MSVHFTCLCTCLCTCPYIYLSPCECAGLCISLHTFTLYNVANIHEDRGDYKLAADGFKRCAAIYSTVYGSDHSKTSDAQLCTGETCVQIRLQLAYTCSYTCSVSTKQLMHKSAQHRPFTVPKSTGTASEYDGMDNNDGWIKYNNNNY